MGASTIILLGERSDAVAAHPAIEAALTMARDAAAIDLAWKWLRTDTVGTDPRAALAGASGVWCTPGSPYASMPGALAAIRHARETRLPFMGTCGGFQHAVIEYARNVLNLREADHAETSPGAALPLISLLACSLVEQSGTVELRDGSRIRSAYGCEVIAERYHCRYGLKPDAEALLDDGDLCVSARDLAGEVRAIELRSHPFFVATLFQHERRALAGELPPLVRAFVQAVVYTR